MASTYIYSILDKVAVLIHRVLTSKNITRDNSSDSLQRSSEECTVW
jgi:hypothetical protein